MDLLGIENDPALLLGVDGRNPARRDKFFGQSSADDAIKVNQPDHRAGILRVGAPESSGQAEEVKTARACALRGEVAPRRDVLFRARKRTCPNQSGLERSTLRQEIFASVFARRNRDRLIEARPSCGDPDIVKSCVSRTGRILVKMTDQAACWVCSSPSTNRTPVTTIGINSKP